MFKGIFVAIITPFKDGEIDETMLSKHVGWLIENGVNGLVPCGTTGEAATLSFDEYAKVVSITADQANGKVPVIAGAGSNCTKKAIDLAQIVVEAGADATLQVTPYYNKPTENGLYKHFAAIAENIKRPHILYNVPGRTSLNLLPETVVKLSKIENIVGIKEASGDLEQIKEIRDKVDDSFTILSGNDDQNLEIYKIGGNGAISVTANIIPDLVSKIWNSFERGDVSGAQSDQNSIDDLNDAMFIETNPIPVKSSLSLMNRCLEEFRLPMCEMSKENRDKLESILKRYKLI